MKIDFTERELRMMNILWEEGSATVREAKEILDDDLMYTSILTVYQTLEEKGHVRHEREGRAYRYYPEVEREDAERSALDYVMERLFRESPERLLMRLVEREPLPPEQLQRLRRILEEASAEDG